MANKRIADLRSPIGDINEARNVFAQIAQIEKTLAVADAKLEAKIHELKQRHASDVADDVTRLHILGQDLTAFIGANRGLFVKPRKIATEFGSFGLQTSSELVIRDEAALIKWAMDNRRDEFWASKVSPAKPAIKAAMMEGEQVPHCDLLTGDTAVYKVAEAILKAAREAAKP